MPWQDNNGGGGGRNPWGQGPQGGGQGPDIDDLIRKGQEKLRAVLPGGGKGSGSFWIFAIFVLLAWAWAGTFTIGPQEQGIVQRFGQYERWEGAGLNWIPWPIETVTIVPVSVIRQTDVGLNSAESQMLTGDENIVDIEFTVFWRIKPDIGEGMSNAAKYLFNIQFPQAETVKAVAESAMREVLGRTPIQRALTEGRLEIEQSTQVLMQSVLDNYGSGIEVQSVKLDRVDPPQQVIESFRDVQKAEADRDRYQNEADKYANEKIPEARGQSAQLTQAAEAYREQVIARATGEASRFNAVYEQYAVAKSITRKRIYLETMEEILTGMDKVIIDNKGGAGVVPYLPLPEVAKNRNRSNQGAE